MAISNETSTLSGNGQVTTGKRKTSRKTPASGAASAAKPSAPVRSEPVEILFTQEPNPYHAPVPPYIWIDFPQANERLTWASYVIRLGAGGAESLQISIDKGAWVPCRLTSGYWWYDWSNIAPGKHTLVARMRTSDGRWFKTPSRNCQFRP